jgi:hypothetical protein
VMKLPSRRYPTWLKERQFKLALVHPSFSQSVIRRGMRGLPKPQQARWVLKFFARQSLGDPGNTQVWA